MRRYKVTFLYMDKLGFLNSAEVEANSRQEAVPIAAKKLGLSDEFSIPSLREIASVVVADRKLPGPKKFSEVKTYGQA